VRHADSLPSPASTARTPPAGRLPRLLPEGFSAGPASLAEHAARYGQHRPAGLSAAQRAALLREVDRSGLTGRGGAAFPTARKLAAVAARAAPVVVADGTEGEPASAKDKVLLARSPHLVLEGAALAAELTGARQVVLVAHPSVRDILDQALTQRQYAGADQAQVRVVTGADRFVAGEASAVVHWIERGVPTPLPRPPRLAERGLGGRPTLVQNVETLAHLALIGRYGADWFRAVGTAAEPGSMLVTIIGAVRQPCVHEVAIGTPVGDVLDLADGAAAPLQALLLGGYFGTWVDAAAALAAPFSRAGLAPLGAGVGAGLIAALPAGRCGLAETARVARYLAGESAGQCGPCWFGLDAIAGAVERLADGRMADLATVRRWLAQVDGRGACSHPDGAVRLIRSALSTFAGELDRHAQGWCRGTSQATLLPVPPVAAPPVTAPRRWPR
jgi:NADH:ubiquinone oxidoreductase subunit F (NADH-binding)